MLQQYNRNHHRSLFVPINPSKHNNSNNNNSNNNNSSNKNKNNRNSINNNSLINIKITITTIITTKIKPLVFNYIISQLEFNTDHQYYKNRHNQPLRKLFLHSNSTFTDIAAIPSTT